MARTIGQQNNSPRQVPLPKTLNQRTAIRQGRTFQDNSDFPATQSSLSRPHIHCNFAQIPLLGSKDVNQISDTTLLGEPLKQTDAASPFNTVQMMKRGGKQSQKPKKRRRTPFLGITQQVSNEPERNNISLSMRVVSVSQPQSTSRQSSYLWRERTSNNDRIVDFGPTKAAEKKATDRDSAVVQAMEIDRKEEDEDRGKKRDREVAGIDLPMTYGEAFGNTGGNQTTVYEAKINGNYFGKFDNRIAFMSKGRFFTDKTLDINKIKHSGIKEDPHAEDFVLSCLDIEYKRLEGDWRKDYPPTGVGQPEWMNLLSLKGDKTSCYECAENLKEKVSNYGLVLREKASLLHSGEDPKNKETGAIKLTNQGYPVRHWTKEQIEKYRKNSIIAPNWIDKNLKEGTQNPTWVTKGKEDAPKFPTPEGEKGWSALGYGRKSGHDNWLKFKKD
jgi:hypothetical protein